MRRLLPLVPAGALGGHLLGYALVTHGHADAVPHTHLPLLVLATLPLVVVGLVRAAVSRAVPSAPQVAALVGAQSAVYLALELAERLPVRDAAATLADPAVLAGLAAQGLVAWALLALARIAGLELDRFRSTRPLVTTDLRAVPRPAGALVPRGDRWPSPYSGRAPPVLLAA